MRKRSGVAGVLALLASVVIGMALSPGSVAQTPTPAKVGLLTPISHASREAAFRQELARLGYVEGRNLVIEYRSAGGDFARLPVLAAELVRLKVDVIVAVVTQAAVAAKAATSTIPIVMAGTADPVASGLVASLARPGGNVTGSSGATIDIVGKQLELLRELLPGSSRVAVLWNPANAVYGAQQRRETEASAARLGLALVFVEARRPEALEGAFGKIAEARPDALMVLGDPLFTEQAQRIAQLALVRRLPAVSIPGQMADAGVLVSYSPDFEAFYRRAAVYVDRILKGAKPADLPVERPTRFELVVNARTAKALGVVLSPALLSRADRVIQ